MRNSGVASDTQDFILKMRSKLFVPNLLTSLAVSLEYFCSLILLKVLRLEYSSSSLIYPQKK